MFGFGGGLHKGIETNRKECIADFAAIVGTRSGDFTGYLSELSCVVLDAV